MHRSAVSCCAVVSLPSGEESETFHLLRGGSDSESCGRSADEACASLRQVLQLYFSEAPAHGLRVITDVSLWISRDLVVRISDSSYKQILCVCVWGGGGFPALFFF